MSGHSPHGTIAPTRDRRHRGYSKRRDARRLAWLFAFAVLALPSHARASLLHGETLDAAANVLAWVVLFIVPVVAIAVFWIVHILPEKIAERKHHPQTKAIQTLCLLSLVFGGLLWPLAWLWAYTKPVFHRMAYGTDVDQSHGHGKPEPTLAEEELELEQLRGRVANLETKLRRRAGALEEGTH